MTTTKLTWDVLSPTGPPLANHIGIIVDSTLYAHGGINRAGSTQPLNGLHRFDFSSLLWEEVRCSGSPALSHHAAILLQNRHLLLIGGWNGKKRTSDIHCFDVKDQKWRVLETTGFPEGAGLSSHTATLLGDASILVVGREGSTRMTRRFGSAYIVTGNVSSGKFSYREAPLDIDSRAGHTTNIVGDKLVIIGGRDDKLTQIHRKFISADKIHQATKQITSLPKLLKPIAKLPSGRKQHVSVAGDNVVFIHGGDTFDGRCREPVGEAYLLSFRPNIQWFSLGNTGVGRSSHLCLCYNDKIMIHGGIAGKNNVVYGDIRTLNL